MEFILPINLDDMSIDPDDYFRFVVWLHSQIEYPISTRQRKILSDYADTVRCAKLYRLESNMRAAMRVEKRLLDLYPKLAKKWQW